MGEVKRLAVDEFEKLSKDYFDDCISTGKPMTITGLALAMGFCSRQSIYDYAKDPEYRYVVGRAKLMVENGYEIRLHDNQCTGAIFALKSFESGVWGGDNDHSDREQKPITINFVDAVKTLNAD